MIKFLIILILMPFFLLGDCFDLEKEYQNDFVLETRKVSVPGFPNAFNPTFVKYKENIILCFRAGKNYEYPEDGDYDYVTERANHDLLNTEVGKYSANNFVFVLLDKNFKVRSTPQILELPFRMNYFHPQDPRLLQVGEDLYLLYSAIFHKCSPCETRRMCVAKLDFKNGKFLVTEWESALDFDGASEKRLEKNWTPFDYKGTLLMSYSLSPHRVLGCYAGKWTDFFNTCCTYDWLWGQLRGGTPAVRMGDHYLGIFHSSMLMRTCQSECNKIQHYFMGAYTFAAEPPFELTGMSCKPIVGKDFYNGEAHQTWKPLRVVWPAGIIVDGDYIWVSYGRQDHEMWIAKLDKKGLYRSLAPVCCE